MTEVITRRDVLRKQRADIIIEDIRRKITTTTSDLLKVGKLLNEFQDKRLYLVYEFSSMTAWLASGPLGVPVPVAKRLMGVAERTKHLDVTDEQLEKIGMARLETILKLKSPKHSEKVLDLIEHAPQISLCDLKQEVKELSGMKQVEKKITITIPVSVVEFERIKELQASGKSLRVAVVEVCR